MPRLLVNNSWYEAVSSRSWYESDYERLVIDRAAELFTSWRCVPFKATVVGDDGARHKPDLALVDAHYRHWCVVEIELAHHDLYGHVMPQVETFRTGNYTSEHATALAATGASLDIKRLQPMMLGDPPDVLVVVDSPNVDWRPVLRARGVGMAVVEPFRDANNHLILRLNGDQPELPSRILTRCIRHTYKRLWRVQSPAALPVTADGESLMIEFAGTSTAWRRVNLADTIMLQASRGDVLADLAAADLVLREDGSLAFVPVTAIRRRRRVREAPTWP
jgi:hypothetical protein